MTTKQTLADALRAKPDLAAYAATESGRAYLHRLLDEQRETRRIFAETVKRSTQGIERCDDAIQVIERVLGSLEA